MTTRAGRRASDPGRPGSSVEPGESTRGPEAEEIAAPAGGGRLARNAAWNLAGQVVPMLVAVLAIPVLIRGLGEDRFGILTLAWLAVGYFSLFDLGLGRALTQVVATMLGAGRESEIPVVVWTALGLMLALGLVGAATAAALAPWLMHAALKVPPGLQAEGWRAFALLAVSIPLVTVAAGLRGILEAQQRFEAVNLVGAVVGAFMYAGPLLVLPYSNSLVPTVAVLLLGRSLQGLIYLKLCLEMMPTLRRGVVTRVSAVRPLLRLGGWMTVSNVVGPLMVSLDRFLIGGVLAVGLVTYYAAPYEVVTKLWIIPGALIRVLFPAFAACHRGDPRQAAELFDVGVRAVFLALLPLILPLVILAGDGLTLWLGADFGARSTRVLQWLAVGVFVNSMGQIAFSLVQGFGRPDLTARLHLAELPIYLVVAWVLIHRLGIEGAAIAWTLRVLADAVLLFALVRRLLPEEPVAARGLRYVAAAALPALGLAVLPTGLAARGLILALVLGALVPVVWLGVLSAGERGLVRGRFERAFHRG